MRRGGYDGTRRVCSVVGTSVEDEDGKGGDGDDRKLAGHTV